MTQEEKQLLLKDLCARLPYDMWVKYDGWKWFVTGYGHGRVSLLPNAFCAIPRPLVEEVKPYLRPMSSMTQEEGLEYEDNEWETSLDDGEKADCIDWLNEHHFDYRGLIERGLALEAPEGMYKN